MNTKGTFNTLAIADLTDAYYNSDIRTDDDRNENFIRDIRDNGQTTPVLVVKTPSGKMLLADGHRRKYALKSLRATKIDAIVYDLGSATEKEAAEKADRLFASQFLTKKPAGVEQLVLYLKKPSLLPDKVREHLATWRDVLGRDFMEKCAEAGVAPNAFFECYQIAVYALAGIHKARQSEYPIADLPQDFLKRAVMWGVRLPINKKTKQPERPRNHSRARVAIARKASGGLGLTAKQVKDLINKDKDCEKFTRS